jgi:predicted nucleic acid-binding protein
MGLLLYVETSAVLRAILEKGTSPEIETRVQGADVLVTSRLSLVESSRAIIRERQKSRISEEHLARVETEIDSVWARCEILELTAAVCKLACTLAPKKQLRTLDALHLASFLWARHQMDGLELLTADDRLLDALQSQ